MSEIRKGLYYTKDHEWLKKLSSPQSVRIGISDFAQASLGDVTFVDLPAVGKIFKKGDVIGTVESVKAVSDIYAPVSGTISSINTALQDDPMPINNSPYDDGWLFEMNLVDEKEIETLLLPEAYESVAQ